MRTVSEIIEKLGGSAAIARELGLKASAVSEMKRRRSIPVKYWSGFIRLAQQKLPQAIDAEVLRAAHECDKPASEVAA